MMRRTIQKPLAGVRPALHVQRMSSTASILADLDELKQRWLGEMLTQMERVINATTPTGSSLRTMAEYHLSTGGKRLRALLPVAVADALGEDPARVLGFGAACELLHNATLVHDDLQDGDTVRRGQPTVWARWGEARAINLGDAMLYWTLAAAYDVDFDAQARERLTQRIVRETLRVVDGQEREFALQSADRPTLDDYFRMVEGKTSGLFALPMAGTAELCGAPPEVVAALERAAGHLGVLFQLQDDVLDLYADKGRGQRGSDLGEGKISALVAHYLEHASPDDRGWLRGLLRSPREELTDEDVMRAAALFRDNGSLRWVLDEIARRRTLATTDAVLATAPTLEALICALTTLFLQPIEAVSASAE